MGPDWVQGTGLIAMRTRDQNQTRVAIIADPMHGTLDPIQVPRNDPMNMY